MGGILGNPKGPASLSDVREAVTASDAAEVKRLAGQIDWANSAKQGVEAEAFWKGLPLSTLPRLRKVSEMADMACVDALAEAPGFLAAFAAAIAPHHLK